MPILCASFISVHQYAQEINNPDAIGQFLRHHLLILGKFILTLLPMPAAALLSSLVPGGWLFLPKKSSRISAKSVR